MENGNKEIKEPVGTNTNALETYEEAMANMDRERLTKEIRDIHNSLTKALDNKQLGAIEEPVFKLYFVKPIAKWMAGIELTDQEEYRLNKYMEIAGSVYDPVEIVDRTGKVLMLAPPLMEKPELTEENNSNNYYVMVRAYNEEHNILPQRAKAYINNKLANIKPIIYAPTGEVTQDWINLIKAYNEQEDELNRATSKQPKSKDNKNTTKTKEDYGIEY